MERTRTIAIIGLSPNPGRDSYKVAKYLQEKGYKIISIRPGQKGILGEKAYASLDELPGSVDIVNVLRRSDMVMPHAEEAIRNKPRAFWMQLMVKNREAAEILTGEDIDVMMDKCIKVEHGKLFK